MTIPEAEVIARAACPRCEQPIGEPCIYTAPRSPYYDDISHWACLRTQVERVGKPTKKVHSERRYKVFELRRAEPHALSSGKAGRYEVRVLANLYDGEWFDLYHMHGARWSGLEPALSRCYQAGWVEYEDRSGRVRITDAGVAALKEGA